MALYTPQDSGPSRRPHRDRSGTFIGRRLRRIRDRLRSPDRSARIGAVGPLVLAAVLVLLLAGWITVLIALPDRAEMDRARFEQATIAYTSDGEVLTRYLDKNRVWVPLDSISEHVVHALLAVEDHRFFQHPGVDVRRLSGAVLETVQGNPQGGSTITMQLARNAFPEIGDDATPIRKFKEIMLALRLEERFGKDAILEMYLNTVPFIYNAFGIEAGAQTYFQKPADDLSVLEAATLVGMLRGPVYYNPVRHPERARERRNLVMQQMVKYGFLEPAAYDSLKDQETPLDFSRPLREDSLAPYFAEYVRQWLEEWAEANGYNLYTDGLRVYTTLDSRLQEAAKTAATGLGEQLQAVGAVEWSRASPPLSSRRAQTYQRFLERLEPFAYFWETNPDALDRFVRQSAAYRQAVENGLTPDTALARLRADQAFLDSLKTNAARLEVGFVAINPDTRHVKAWVGGRDFSKNQYDHVAMARRQPGSTFKPFVYLAALQEGWSMRDRLPDVVRTYRNPQTGQTWRPQNVGGATGRMITLKNALAYSKNTITAQLVDEVGPERVAEVAHRLGIESELEPVPSIGLGTSSVSLLELVNAYCTVASLGYYSEPVVVTRIENNRGRVLATFSAQPRRVLDAHTAYTLIDMMRAVADYGTGRRIQYQYGARGDVAAKTGTSQGGADGWFVLMHPDLVVGAWTGFSTPTLHFRSNYWGQGAHTALPVVGEFYREVQGTTETFSDASFQEPPGWEPAPPTYDPYADSLFVSPYDTLTLETDSLMTTADSLIDASGQGSPRTGGGEEDEPLSAADSLNLREARTPLDNRTTPEPQQAVEPDTTTSER